MGHRCELLAHFYVCFFLKFSLLAPLREKKCLNGGCGVPDEEDRGERDEVDSGRFSEGETEEESLIDCGLKLRKVSFTEKVDDVRSVSFGLSSLN